jgi:FtsP/CotA-like multicopper oxidase with cupredoxin domain
LVRRIRRSFKEEGTQLSVNIRRSLEHRDVKGEATMKSRVVGFLACLLIVTPMLFTGAASGGPPAQSAAPERSAAVTQTAEASTSGQAGNQTHPRGNGIPYADRQAAAGRAKAQGMVAGGVEAAVLDPNATPHYFGPYANYANTQLPAVVTTTPSPVWYFAEGTTRPNFQPYICIQNPGNIDASVLITYMKGDGKTATQTLMVRKNSRSTVAPDTVIGTGEDEAHDFSAKVECINGQKILAERPMYFNYKGKWNGGHDVVGATAPAATFYFAEGTTRPDFDPYICIQNPGTIDADVTITYMKGDGTNIKETLKVSKHSRSTVQPRFKLGTADDAAHDFSAVVRCTNGQTIVAERPMYFDYDYKWDGGHNAMGATDPGSTFYFAEGTCRPDFDPYYCIQNPGRTDANVTLTYMKGDGNISTQKAVVKKNSRSTVIPRQVLGTGDDAVHDFSTTVACTNGQKIFVERPMYFNYKGKWDDGHDAVGATSVLTSYYFAEGTCRPGFDPYLCIQNPGDASAGVRITYMKGDGTTATASRTVDASSRATILPRDTLGTGDDAAHDFSVKVECTNNKQILVERPMYFDFKGDTGGSNAVGYSFPGASTSVVPGTGVRKFVDTLPGLNAAAKNDLGQYIPVGIPNKTKYPGSDYYEIELGQYTEKMHRDMPATTLRGYRQTNAPDPNVNKFHYLGPAIVAQKDRPVRIKFTNALPTGAGGDLFLPTDTTVMGAGMGPTPGENYTQNRATLHLHGGNTPWISDGTPHQWITPAGETTSYPKGVSVQNVPDMWYDALGNPVPAGTPGASNDPGDGSMTFYYTNQQSARLMFYHDHAYGITRLNVYAGEAAPYLVQDSTEKSLKTTGTIPTDELPLVIQDKTFVPDDKQLAGEDPTWNKAKWGGKGSLWQPHVYMTNQNPADPSGFNAFGRWHYGPWFWPPTTNITHPPVPNPYAGTAPWENDTMPATPNPSMAMEAFQDTPLVNGTAYPSVTVQPKSYRLRVLNGADDRFFNLQMYTAKSQNAMWKADGTLNDGDAGEVRMVPAVPTASFPATWPRDARDGGVPDPTTAGPSWIQIGTEGGFLPAPVVVPNQPVTYNMNPTTFNFGNVQNHSLLLAPAERADCIVDFSKYAGKTLILYNDSPAPFPAIDPRYDYYTGNPDLTGSGGAPATQPGYGPNTRTIMMIKVAKAKPASAFNMAKLNAAFASTATTQGVFASSQDPIIVPEARYNSAYHKLFPTDPFVRIADQQMTFNTVISGTSLTIPFEQKALHDEMGAAFDVEYGRMSGFLGLEMPNSSPITQRFVQYPLASPPVDITVDAMVPGVEPAAGDGTQIWKITHNGVDTHPIHFHKFDVQLINRVAWDNNVLPPDATELGWKETVRVNPLEDTIVALRPVVPQSLPFDVPNSTRPMDPTRPVGDLLPAPPPAGVWQDMNGNPTVDPIGGGGALSNQVVNFGWEYVYHCHILSHEEMDMMHAMPLAVKPPAPSTMVATGTSPSVALSWTDNSINETGFEVEATDDGGTTWIPIMSVGPGTGKGTTITPPPDTSVWGPGTRTYRVFARNQVGLTFTPNFPITNADSAPVLSNPVTNP